MPVIGRVAAHGAVVVGERALLHMPEMDGWLRSLQSLPEAEAMEIVVITGLDAMASARSDGLPADVQILVKPVSLRELEQIAKKLAEPFGRRH